jgi:translation initiation factor 3 subunit K
VICRYQFNPHLTRDETITNILVKTLTVFPNPDFSLGISLLPPHVLAPLSSASHTPAAGDAPLSEAVQKLNVLNNLLAGADYASFWSTLDSDDLYADLVADVSGFEELMRVRIAVTVSQAIREVDRSLLEGWLNLQGKEFEHFVGSVCGWNVDGTKVKVPLNKENEAKGTVVRENVKFDRKNPLPKVLCQEFANLNAEFARVIKRAYEQPA